MATTCGGQVITKRHIEAQCFGDRPRIMSSNSTWNILNVLLTIVLALGVFRLYKNHQECRLLRERLAAASQQKIEVIQRLSDLAAEKTAPIKRELLEATLEISRTRGTEKGGLVGSGSKALIGGISDLCGTAFPILVDSLLDEKKLN